MILCNKSLKTNRISHSRRWFSHQGWIANKEDYYNSRDQTKEIGNELCINPELSQFLNLQVDFLLKYTMFDHLHWWSIFFSIQTCSIPSFLSQNNMVPNGIRIFKSLDKSKCGFLPTLRGNHISRSPGKMNVVTYIHICKSQGKINVGTFLYRDVSTFAKVRAKWMWMHSYIERNPHGLFPFWGRNVLFTETSCLILVEEKLYY